MRLNLVYPDQSDIQFKISKFPDGQQSIVIQSFVAKRCEFSGKCTYGLLQDLDQYTVNIKSHLNSFGDLEMITNSVQALRELGVTKIHLYTPYFLGARSDRKFVDGGINYLKSVICPIINALKLTTITVLDPHSDVLEGCLNNFRKLSNTDLIKWAVNDLKSTNYILASPDAGALKKIYDVCFDIKYVDEIVTCLKHRDPISGDILGAIVPKADFGKRDVVLIDDICDGGRTFIELAKIIKERNPGKLILIITHGLFSAGYKELAKYFDIVYTTNSIKDITPQSIMSDDMTRGILTEITKPNFVKQLNVY